MYKILVILFAAVLLSLGLTYPELIMQQDQTDSTISILNDEVLLRDFQPEKSVTVYDVPRPDGEPLPPPPDDDEEDFAQLWPQ